MSSFYVLVKHTLLLSLGPHCHRMGTVERRAALQAQYFFFCECSACMSNEGETFDPVQERLWALRCASCSGPLLHEAQGREPAGSKVAQTESHSHFMICEACGSHQPITSLVHDAFLALGLFKRGKSATCPLSNSYRIKSTIL